MRPIAIKPYGHRRSIGRRRRRRHSGPCMGGKPYQIEYFGSEGQLVRDKGAHLGAPNNGYKGPILPYQKRTLCVRETGDP